MSKEYPCVYYDNEKCRKYPPEEGYVGWCVLGPCSHETPSNGDRVRAMSDEEIAKLFYANCPPKRISTDICDSMNDCTECWLDWLNQPAKEA